MVVTWRPLIPVIDGELLTGAPIPTAGASADTPVLLGTDRDEYRLFLPLAVPPGTLDEAGFLTWAERYGLSEDGAREYLRGAEPDSTPWDVLASVIGDERSPSVPPSSRSPTRPTGTPAAPTGSHSAGRPRRRMTRSRRSCATISSCSSSDAVRRGRSAVFSASRDVPDR